MRKVASLPIPALLHYNQPWPLQVPPICIQKLVCLERHDISFTRSTQISMAHRGSCPLVASFNPNRACYWMRPPHKFQRCRNPLGFTAHAAGDSHVHVCFWPLVQFSMKAIPFTSMEALPQSVTRLLALLGKDSEDPGAL